MKYVLLITFLIFPLHSVSAQPSMTFDAAISLWLEGDDVNTLPVIAQFAKDGNIEAQIFLARIIRSSSFTSDYVRALTRKDRIALFKQPTGLSGTSWLKAAAEHSELAVAFIDANSIGSTNSEKLFNAAVILMELGERKAAFIAYNRFQNGLGHRAFVQLHMPDRLPPEIDLLLSAYKDTHSFLSSSTELTEGDINAFMTKLREQYSSIWEVAYILGILSYSPLSTEERNQLTSGRTLSVHENSPESLLAFEDWLLSSPARQAISLPCQRACPNEVGACVRVAHWMLPLD